MSPLSTGEDVAPWVSNGVAFGLFELPAVFDPTEEQTIAHRTDVAISGGSLVHRGTLEGRARGSPHGRLIGPPTIGLKPIADEADFRALNDLR